MAGPLCYVLLFVLLRLTGQPPTTNNGNIDIYDDKNERCFL